MKENKRDPNFLLKKERRMQKAADKALKSLDIMKKDQLENSNKT